MFLIFNGELRPEEALLLQADNRGFRYGDGIFESMMVRDGRVRLGRYHLDRLAAGMRALQLELPQVHTIDILERQIEALCSRNGLAGDSRVRLTVFRAGGGLYNVPDNQAAYILQASELAPVPRGQGLVVGIYPDGMKVSDVFSAIKSNNYLLSSMAGRYAKERNWDDCLLLNASGRIAEAAAANVWWVRRDVCFTPPLTEGCVAGVMRRFLLEALPKAGLETREEPIGPVQLAEADEIFISNAIRGVQGIVAFGDRRYDQRTAVRVSREIIDIL